MWAYLEHQDEEMWLLATNTSSEPESLKGSGGVRAAPVPLYQGQELTIQIAFDNTSCFQVMRASPQTKQFQRRGQPDQFSFPVQCQSGIAAGTYLGDVLVEVGGLRVAEFWFYVDVDEERSPPASSLHSPERQRSEIGRSKVRLKNPQGVTINNSPGWWDVMISYTQRNKGAQLLAAELYASLLELGKTVWLDVKMDKRNEAAMQEAAQKSKCIVAVVSGVEREGDSEDSAYFKRAFCVNELRWAREGGVPIQPVIMREDKDHIGKFLGQAPEDLQDLGKVDFKTLDRVAPAIWNAGIGELIKSIDDLIASSPEPEPKM